MAGKPATLTVGRLAWRRLRRDWAAYVPTSLGLGVALGLATAVILTQAMTEEASLRSHLAHLGSSSLVEVRQSQAVDQGGYETFKRETERASRDDMGGLVRPAGYRLLSGGNVPISRNGVRTAQLPRGDPRASVVRLAAYEAIESHADLLSGRWPEPVRSGPWPASISESTARATGLVVGDVECVSGLDLENQPACFAITGLFRPHDLAEPFWGSDLFPPIAYVLPVGSYFAILAGQRRQLSDAIAVLVPNLAAIRAGNIDQVLERLRRLRGLFSVRLADTTIVTQLDQDLDAYVHRSRVASFAVQLVAAQLLLVAFYCAGFLAWRLLQQQRAQIAVWRTRGWRWTSIALLLALEMSVVAAAALPVGLGAGVLAADVVSHLAYGGRDLFSAGLEPGRLWMPLAAAFGTGLVLVWAMAAWTAARGGLRQRQTASRPPTPWWRRWHLDLVLAALSLPLLAQAQLLGSAQVRESGGAPPYGVLLPALALVFIALAGLRLIPVFAGAAAYLSRGVESRLAGVQLGRAPAQHAGLGLLLALTVGVGVFASTFATTSAQSATDRAAYSAGADVRAVFGGFLPHEFEKLRLPGAAVQSPVFNSYARPGASNSEVPLVGVEPYTFKQVAWSRPDLFPRPLAEQVQVLADKERGGLVLPEGASKLSMWVFGASTGGQLHVRLSAADGRPVRADFGALDFNGWRQLEAELAPAPAGLHQPLRLRELAFTPVDRIGTLALSRLTAAGPPLPSPVLLEDFAGAEVSTPSGPRIMGSPWWQSDPESGTRLGGLMASTRIPRDGARTVSIYLQPGWRFAHLTPFRPAPPPPNLRAYPGRIPPVSPALASSSVLRRLGLKVGDSIQLQLDNVPLPVKVEGTIDYFPTVYSRQGDFFVVSLEPSLAAIGMFGHRRPWPDQLWVKAQPGHVGSVASALRSTPDVVDVFDRGRLEAEARAAPLRVSLAANLGLGFAAMLLLALLGFAIHFGLVARSRASDYAVLEANGMDPGQIRRSLALEQAVLVAFSLFAGYALGLLLSMAVLPDLQVGAELTETVPPPLVRVNPGLVGGALALVAVLTLAAGRLIGRAGSRVDLVGELRALG